MPIAEKPTEEKEQRPDNRESDVQGRKTTKEREIVTALDQTQNSRTTEQKETICDVYYHTVYKDQFIGYLPSDIYDSQVQLGISVLFTVTRQPKHYHTGNKVYEKISRVIPN